MPAAVEPPVFECDVQPARDRVRVSPVGELELATVEVLEREVQSLLDRGFRSIVIDLRGLTFVDSTGLRCLLTLAQASESVPFRLELVRGGGHVHRIFELTGLADALPFVETS